MVCLFPGVASPCAFARRRGTTRTRLPQCSRPSPDSLFHLMLHVVTGPAHVAHPPRRRLLTAEAGLAWLGLHRVEPVRYGLSLTSDMIHPELCSAPLRSAPPLPARACRGASKLHWRHASRERLTRLSLSSCSPPCLPACPRRGMANGGGKDADTGQEGQGKNGTMTWQAQC